MSKWEIYLAYVRYEDTDGGKHRPVLVVEDGTAYPISCLKMTSHEPRYGEYAIIRWREAGLHKQTTIRISKILYLNEDDFVKKIGDLDPVDISNIEKMISQL